MFSQTLGIITNSLIRWHSSWGSFLFPVERTWRPTSSKTTGLDSRFIISMDLSWVLALSSSIWIHRSKSQENIRRIRCHFGSIIRRNPLPLLRFQPSEWTLGLLSPPFPAPGDGGMKQKWRMNIIKVEPFTQESHAPVSNTTMMQLSCNPTFKTCYCKLVSTCRGSALAWIHSRPLSS